MRSSDQRRHCSRRQLRSVHFVGERKYAARNCSLDDIRAILHLKPHRLSNFIRAIRNAVCVVRLASKKKIAKPAGGIKMSASGADAFRRDEHSRADYYPFVDRIT